MRTIGDLNNDGFVTNADLQGLLNYLAQHGNGSLNAVPEPSTFALAAIAVLGLCVRVVRVRNQSGPN